tara:strand:+ start:228 stop:1214 length:987 start_codon:yes stop_codon:yes gene_type:complete
MKKPLAILLLFFGLTFAQIELPKPRSGEQIISHMAYTLSYNEAYEQANWVTYELKASTLRGSFERTDDFRSDPEITTGSASLADYKGSGYDRGHLAPAGDMKWSYRAMSESFYMSNMSPQTPSFNRGIWKRLEDQVRGWAVDNQIVYVTTGPVLQGNLSSIGSNGVSVPRQYYKVILDYTEPELKGIGFILNNEKGVGSLENYSVSIDRVEEVTGIDFFHSVPNDLENAIEATLDISLWSFKPYRPSSASGGTAVQCLGTTKKGLRCKNKTNNSNEYCYQHTPKKKELKSGSPKLATAVRCSGTTKKGLRCKRKTKSSNGRCYQHGGN